MINISTIEKKPANNNKDNSILIIGKGDSEFKNKEILKAISISDVEYNYGKASDLTSAYKEAVAIGAINIYVCNCTKFTDYIDIIDYICKEEFTYIVPLFNFSETFTLENNKVMYLCEFYSNRLSESITQLFITDKHASLYEDLDHYLKNMNSIITTFKKDTMTKLINGSNLCFILNTLTKYKFANVALASILTQSDLREYPKMDIGEVVFDLNNYDLYGQEATYFSYDNISKTTIENFLNFNKNNSPEKFVPVNLIKQIILRSMDFSSFKGKLFSPYMRISLENNITSIMRVHVETLIESYKLQDIRFVSNADHTVSIYILLTIKPYNSIEELNMTMEM